MSGGNGGFTRMIVEIDGAAAPAQHAKITHALEEVALRAERCENQTPSSRRGVRSATDLPALLRPDSASCALDR